MVCRRTFALDSILVLGASRSEYVGVAGIVRSRHHLEESPTNLSERFLSLASGRQSWISLVFGNSAGGCYYLLGPRC
jgi:hypothetical protein